MRYNRKYLEKIINVPLPPIPEKERIYLNVPYMAKDFARYSNCGFDSEKKLWFTGEFNSNLQSLIALYGVNKVTTETAKKLLKDKIGD